MQTQYLEGFESVTLNYGCTRIASGGMFIILFFSISHCSSFLATTGSYSSRLIVNSWLYLSSLFSFIWSSIAKRNTRFSFSPHLLLWFPRWKPEKIHSSRIFSWRMRTLDSLRAHFEWWGSDVISHLHTKILADGRWESRPELCSEFGEQGEDSQSISRGLQYW